MKKKKNRLSNLIKWELICLVAVTLLVAGLIKWSEGRLNAAPDNSARQTVSGVVKAQEGPGGNLLGGAGSSAAGNLAGTQGGGEDGQTKVLTPGAGMSDGTKDPGKNEQENVPTPGAGTSAGTQDPKKNEQENVPTPETGTSVGTQDPGEEQKPAGTTVTPKPTQALKPQNTPTPKPQTPTPTQKPQNTPTPKPENTPIPTPTQKPQNTPTPTPESTPTPKPNYAEGMDTDFIESLDAPQSGELITADGAVDTVYYMQTDSRWGNKIYGGEDTIAKYACGPTSMAIVVSSLTNIKIDPLQMSGWAFNKGYWYPKSGSLHSVVNGTAKAFGLKSEGVGNDADTPKKVKDALKNGDMAVVLMGKGHFTKGGHFIVLRGITAEGKILVADCNSRENTMTEWDFETIQSEAKWASDGGPFWIIRNPNIMQ